MESEEVASIYNKACECVTERNRLATQLRDDDYAPIQRLSALRCIAAIMRVLSPSLPAELHVVSVHNAQTDTKFLHDTLSKAARSLSQHAIVSLSLQCLKATKALEQHVHSLLIDHYSLALTVVSNIPMKDGQTKKDFDVPLLHTRQARLTFCFARSVNSKIVRCLLILQLHQMLHDSRLHKQCAMGDTALEYVDANVSKHVVRLAWVTVNTKVPALY